MRKHLLSMTAMLFAMATGAWAQTEWGNASGLPMSAGNYKLTTDVSIDDTWSVPNGETTIDLNGHGIIMTSTNYGAWEECSVMNVTDGCKLTIKDTNSSNTGGDGRPSGIVGGYITGGHGTSYSDWDLSLGGGIFVQGGIFTLDGGTICGNSLDFEFGADGGGVCVIEGGTFIMNGGYIKNNIGSGGGVCVGTGCPGPDDEGTAGTFIMNGGVISDNSTKTGDSNIGINNIRLLKGKAELRGGKIIGNFGGDDNDGNVVEIYSGFTSTASERCDFYIPKNESSPKVLTIKESLGNNIYGVRPYYFEDDAMYTYAQVFTSGLPGNGGLGNFVSLDNDYKLVLDASNEARIDKNGTGIASVKADNEADVWYNLSGQRLSGKPAKKGITLHGGKKILF